LSQPIAIETDGDISIDIDDGNAHLAGDLDHLSKSLFIGSYIDVFKSDAFGSKPILGLMAVGSSRSSVDLDVVSFTCGHIDPLLKDLKISRSDRVLNYQ